MVIGVLFSLAAVSIGIASAVEPVKATYAVYTGEPNIFLDYWRYYDVDCGTVIAPRDPPTGAPRASYPAEDINNGCDGALSHQRVQSIAASVLGFLGLVAVGVILLRRQARLKAFVPG
jgi:hypothetical protein